MSDGMTVCYDTTINLMFTDQTKRSAAVAVVAVVAVVVVAVTVTVIHTDVT
jgi:hypothetical protein